MSMTLRQQQSLISFCFVTLIAGIPLWIAAAWYLFVWLPQAPFAPPGDPNIGVGIAFLVAVCNIPILLLAWAGWALWPRWRHGPIHRNQNPV